MAGAGRVVATQDVCKVIELAGAFGVPLAKGSAGPSKRGHRSAARTVKSHTGNVAKRTPAEQKDSKMKAQTRALFLLPAPVRRTPPNILSVLAVVCIAEFLLAVAAYGLWRHFH